MAIRILIVDDNRDFADSQAMLVRIWGYDVSIEHDAPSALEHARAYHPDVMLIDLGMPVLDGCVLAQTLRDDPRTRHITLIAISGHATAEFRKKADEAGFDDFFVKPADPDGLKERLSRCCARHTPMPFQKPCASSRPCPEQDKTPGASAPG